MTIWTKATGTPDVWFILNANGTIARVHPGNHDAVRSSSVVVAASNARLQSKEDADLVCDGTADDDELNLAIEMLNDGGGGTLLLTEGQFNIAAAVNVKYSNTAICGRSRGATVVKAAANLNARVFNIAPPADITDIQFRDMTIDGNGTNQSDFPSDRSTTSCIAIDNSLGKKVTDLVLDTVTIQNAGGLGAAIQGGSSAHIVRPSVINCLFLTNGLTASNGDGLYFNYGDDVQVVGSRAVSNTDSGFGFDHCTVVTAYGLVARGNYNPGGGAQQQIAFARASSYGHFSHCHMDGASITGTIGFATGKFGDTVAVTTNLFLESCSMINGATAGLHLEDNTVAKIMNCFFTNNGTAVAYAGTDLFSFFRGNVGYTTEKATTATITTGTTSIVVTHGLALTPVDGTIILTPLNKPTNAPRQVYVDTYTSTQFTIHCDADPGASGLTVAWTAAVGGQL